MGVTWLLLYRLPLPFAAKDVAVFIALWFGWMLVSLAWAPDKAAGLRYLVILLTMMLLVAATAAAGTSRRRLEILGYTFILAFLAIIGVTVLEYTIGFRLPTSRLTTVITSQTYAVTSVFHNQNDLATYLAICWPFILCAYFFTRRVGWLALATAAALFSAAAFVRTGSRSSLLAVAVECVAALVLFEGLASRLATRRGKVLVAVVAAILVLGRRLPAVQRFAVEHAAPVPAGDAHRPGQGKQGLGGAASGPDQARPADRRRQPAAGRRPRPGRGHHRIRHRSPGHRQPAQLVAGDVRRRRPGRASPCTCCSSCSC